MEQQQQDTNNTEDFYSATFDQLTSPIHQFDSQQAQQSSPSATSNNDTGQIQHLFNNDAELHMATLSSPTSRVSPMTPQSNAISIASSPSTTQLMQMTVNVVY
jgi:hypothetical protein